MKTQGGRKERARTMSAGERTDRGFYIRSEQALTTFAAYPRVRHYCCEACVINNAVTFQRTGCGRSICLTGHGLSVTVQERPGHHLTGISSCSAHRERDHTHVAYRPFAAPPDPIRPQRPTLTPHPTSDTKHAVVTRPLSAPYTEQHVQLDARKQTRPWETW